MIRLGPTSFVALLLASTSAEAQIQPRLPTNQPPTPVITPSGKAPSVQGAPKAAATTSGVDALLAQAANQRRRGRKDLAAQALQRALRASPNNPAVLQRLATYALQDGDTAGAQGWTDRLKAVAPRDSRVAALERDIKAAQAAPVSVSPTAPTRVAEAPPAQTQSPPRATGAAPAPRTQTAEAPARPATPAPPAPPADPGGEARANGFKALNAGEIADADRYFNQALRARGDDLDAAGGLGVVRLRQERFADARALLERAIRGAQGSERWGEALRTAVFFGDLARARNAYVGGRYAEAEAAARPLASGSHPNRVEAQILLGQALAAQGRAAEAEAAFRQATLLAPQRTEAATGLAQALADLGRFDEAARLLRDIPGGRAAPIMAEVERARAADLQRRGDSFGAGAALAASLQAAPDNAWTRLEYARFLIGQGQAQQANQVAAPLYNSSDPDSLQAAALFSEARGRSDEAAALLSRIPAGSRNPAVRQLAARVDAQRVIAQAKQAAITGQPVQGVTILRQYLSSNDAGFATKGQMAETLLDLGDTYQAGALALEAARNPPAQFDPGEASGYLTVLGKTGQDQAAMTLLQAAAQQTQRSPGAQASYRGAAAVYAAQRADRLRAAGDYATAFDTLSQAFALAPRDPGLLAALGRLYQSGNMPQQALQAYDALLAVAPNDTTAVMNAARAAQASGDNSRAERLMKRAISLRPGDPEMYYALGQFEQSRGRDRAALDAFKRADALIRSGRSQGLMGVAPNAMRQPGQAPAIGGGILGPNPFIGRPAAAIEPSNYTAASGYAGYAPLAMAQPMGAAAMVEPQMAAATPVAVPAAAVVPDQGYGGAAMQPVAQPYSQTAQPAYAPQAYAQPSYAVPSYPVPAYAQPAYNPPAYAQPAYAAPPTYIPQPAYPQPAYAQPTYIPQPAYAPAQYPQPAYPQAAYPQAAYPQAAYPQAAYPQPAYPQAAYPQPYSPPASAPAATAGTYAQNAQAAEYLPNVGQPAYGAQPYGGQSYGYGAPAYGAAVPANGSPYPATTPNFALPQPAAGPAYPQYAQGPYGAQPYGAQAGIPGITAPAPPPAELPLPARINQEIADLRQSTAPQITGAVNLRTRSGEAGASQLFEVAPRMEASFSPFGVGRLGVSLTPVIISAGTPDADASSRIGTTPMRSAEALVNEDKNPLPISNSVSDRGAAVSLFYNSTPLSVDVGATPIGFDKIGVNAGVTARLTLGEAQIRLTAEARPVTDSVLSYAGVVDRWSGLEYGRVTKTAGTLGGSFNFDNGGAYLDATYKRLDGDFVLENTGYEVNGGAYYRPVNHDGDIMQVGVNVNLQAYDENQRFFSFGHGGYFSPQQFVSIALPVSYSRVRDRYRWNAGVTFGLQSYSEDSAPIFPTSRESQATIEAYQQLDPDVVTRYAGQDRTGLAVAANLGGEYNLVRNTAAGGEMTLDTFGAYKEYKVRFYLRQTFAN